MEEWVEIKNSENQYQISTEGKVASLKYGDKRIKKPFRDKDGYLSIGLSIGNRVITKKVHHLVVENFIRDFDKKTEQVNHINHVRDDNRLQNLEIVTKQQHRKDPITIENMKKAFKGRKYSQQVKRKRSQIMKRISSTEQWRTNHSQKMKQYWARKKNLKKLV